MLISDKLGSPTKKLPARRFTIGVFLAYDVDADGGESSGSPEELEQCVGKRPTYSGQVAGGYFDGYHLFGWSCAGWSAARNLMQRLHSCRAPGKRVFWTRRRIYRAGRGLCVLVSPWNTLAPMRDR